MCSKAAYFTCNKALLSFTEGVTLLSCSVSEAASDGSTVDEEDARYCFTSQSIIYIHNLIRPYICNITNRSHALTSQQILCVALRFFANVSFLYNVGDAEHLSKATVYSQIAT
ncbi:hypothetical protein N1851_020592 [Merluccius polli]|uniref:Uncharacterized protein n=1 Tax=Merluccius polli TaxID=89951 RepID=A0AA47NWV9_MERPO|nr:hypothetical protein N1851_020592 [Merluccius polli]